jgi:hypothetical protein
MSLESLGDYLLADYHLTTRPRHFFQNVFPRRKRARKNCNFLAILNWILEYVDIVGTHVD